MKTFFLNLIIFFALFINNVNAQCKQQVVYFNTEAAIYLQDFNTKLLDTNSCLNGKGISKSTANKKI